MKDERGFSLIELIIVMAILGVLLGIAAYSWSRYVENARLKTAVREVMVDLEFARERAKTENVTYTVTFTDRSPTYTISNGTTTQTKSLSAIGTNIAVESTSFTGNQVKFFPRGTVTMGNIVIKNQRGSTGTITINITGRMYVTYDLK